MVWEGKKGAIASEMEHWMDDCGGDVGGVGDTGKK